MVMAARSKTQKRKNIYEYISSIFANTLQSRKSFTSWSRNVVKRNHLFDARSKNPCENVHHIGAMCVCAFKREFAAAICAHVSHAFFLSYAISIVQLTKKHISVA